MQDQPGGVISPQSPTSGGPEPEAPRQIVVNDMNTAPEMPEPASPESEQLVPASTPASNQPAWTPPVQPVTPVNPVVTAPMEPSSMTPMPPPNKPGLFASKKKKLLLLVAPLVLLLGGGSAFGYYAYVYLPNQPDNVVLAALADLAQKTEMTVDTKTDYTPKNGGQAVAVDLKLQTNTLNNQLAASGTVGVSGAQIPFETRYLEKNLYMKVGGLESLAPLLGEAASAYGPIIEEVNDQWYVFDRSLWDSLSTEAGCVTDVSFVFTDDDIDIIEAAYRKHPLFKVTGSSSEKVGDVDTTKYIVDPSSDEEAASFAGELKELSFVKKLQKCLPDESEEGFDEEITDFKDEANTALEGTFAIYITDDKKVQKIELTSEDEEASVAMSGVFDYSPVSISAPEGAKPAQELILTLYGGYSLGWNMGGIEGSVRDTERKNDIAQLQAKLEEYSANHNGKYPLTSKLSQAGITAEELTGPSGDAYVYESDGQSYSLTAQLESAPQEESTYTVSGGR